MSKQAQKDEQEAKQNNRTVNMQLSAYRFRIPKKFDKSRTTTLSVKVDQQWAFFLDKVYSDAKYRKRLPWDSPSDMYRWCFWEGVNQLQMYLDSDTISEDYAKYKALIEGIRQWEFEVSVGEVLESARKLVEKMERDGDHRDIPFKLHQLESSIRAIPGYQGKKLLKEFHKRYKGYLDQGKLDVRPSRAQADD